MPSNQNALGLMHRATLAGIAEKNRWIHSAPKGYTYLMRLKALLFSPAELRGSVFPESVLGEFSRCADFLGDPIEPSTWREQWDRLAQVEVIVGTWGMPLLDAEFLAAAPNLRAVFYAAGSVKGFVTDASWDRGILVSSAWTANGIPVAEYTIGTILLSLKRFWHLTRAMREPGGLGGNDLRVPGGYHSKVGLVSLGVIGRATARLLRPFEIDVFAYDPFLPSDQAGEIGVTLISLEDLFRECDVVSIHTPWIPSTERMIGRKLLSSMKEGATLINTSRGAVVAEDELCEVLAERPDLSAVLDVTYPEPAAPDSPLRSLPNVMLTPHIAGSMQAEHARMARWMADELVRFASGEPLRYRVERDMLAKMA